MCIIDKCIHEHLSGRQIVGLDEMIFYQNCETICGRNLFFVLIYVVIVCDFRNTNIFLKKYYVIYI